MKAVRFVALFVALSLVAASTQAATTAITSRAGFAGNDHVDWGTLGVPFATVSNPFNINSVGGVGMTVSMPGGGFERRDQWTGGWDGNFAQGDHLLWTESNAGPITIFSFSTPIMGAGAQIQADFYGSFQGTISAYDASNNLLGALSMGGNSNGNNDNSAIFLGIRSDTANIAKIAFNLVNEPDFAINQLDLATTSGVPLPAAAWGGLALMAGLVVRRIRR